ncbi:MAG: hypothetical protein Q4C22_06980, partial [Bacillota bacterium]|nr:hypothetical protein [Bacillota bacterium]
AEESPCTYVHIHDESCGYDAGTGGGCTDVHSHNEACGYAEGSPCTYVHIHDESCGYAGASPCTHVCDESCGYGEEPALPVTGSPAEPGDGPAEDAAPAAEEAETSLPALSLSSLPPAISATVPLYTVVTVSADGTCTVAGGSIVNNTEAPIYLTGVSYEWQTEGTADADELFSDYTAITATLTLGEVPYVFTGETPAAAAPNTVIAAQSGGTPGTLALSWTFALNGNYLNYAPGDSVQIASIIYTVDYQPAAAQ